MMAIAATTVLLLAAEFATAGSAYTTHLSALNTHEPNPETDSLQADYLRGTEYAERGQLRLAELYWKKVLSAAIHDKESFDVYCECAASYAGMLVNKRSYAEALQVALPAVEKIEQTDESSELVLAVLLESVGRCQLNLSMKKEAAQSYDRAFQYYRIMEAEDNTSESLRHTVVAAFNTALSYLNAKEYAGAQLWTTRADSLLVKYKDKGDSNARFTDLVAARLQLQHAVALQGMGRTQEAERMYNAYLQTPYGQSDDGRIDATSYLVAARRYSEAADNYRHLDRILHSWNVELTLDNVKSFLFPKFKANVGAGRKDSAIAVGMRIIEAIEASADSTKVNDAAELATIYETNQKAEKIALQQSQIEEHESQMARYRWLVALAGLLLVVVFLIVYSVNRTRAQRRLAEANSQLEQKNEQLTVANARAEESSRMKAEFIQHISHEIRTPLNVLSGFSQILTADDVELDENARRDINRQITENTDRITGLVNKMLELSDVNSKAVLERNDQVLGVQIAAQAAEDSGITQAKHLHFDMQFGEGADSVLLQTNLASATRALTLLLDNARKFTKPAEALNAETGEQKTVLLRMTISNGQLQFIVEDDGIGVPAEEAERIFDEFVQLNEYYDGTGIGLTVARSIARRLGGDIVLDTTYDKGARFVMSLPANL